MLPQHRRIAEMAFPRKFGPINRGGRSRSDRYRVDLETANPAQLSFHAMTACGRLDSEAVPCRASWVLVYGEPPLPLWVRRRRAATTFQMSAFRGMVTRIGRVEGI